MAKYHVAPYRSRWNPNVREHVYVCEADWEPAESLIHALQMRDAISGWAVVRESIYAGTPDEIRQFSAGGGWAKTGTEAVRKRIALNRQELEAWLTPN